MVTAMNALRLSAAVSAVTAILAAASALGACDDGPTITLSDCATPLQGELAADGSVHARKVASSK